MSSTPPFLQPLHALGPQWHAQFVERVPGVPTGPDKNQVLRSLRKAHWHAARELGFAENELHLAEQVHGSDLAEATGPANQPHPQVDGLLACGPGTLLGIHVADCAAVYLVDPTTQAFALLHSGKKGTEQAITSRAIAHLHERWHVDPTHLHLFLSPCIRPPHYEVDFATEILAQAQRAGLPKSQIHDSGLCTASDPQRFYSYRREKGHTGRLFALLGCR